MAGCFRRRLLSNLSCREIIASLINTEKSRDLWRVKLFRRVHAKLMQLGFSMFTREISPDRNTLESEVIGRKL